MSSFKYELDSYPRRKVSRSHIVTFRFEKLTFNATFVIIDDTGVPMIFPNLALVLIFISEYKFKSLMNHFSNKGAMQKFNTTMVIFIMIIVH